MYFASIIALCWAFAMQPSPAPAQAHDSPETETSTSSSTERSPAPAKKKTVTPQKKKHRKPAPEKAKVVVPNGGAKDPSVQFSTTASPQQASKEREKTADLVSSTNSNLEKLSGQTLNPTQEDTVKQIQTYLQQAKTAEAAGDLQSAQNLALKAQLLSNDLVQK